MKEKKSMKRIGNLWLDSRLGWASHCDSKNFIRDEIEPYVDIKTTRGIVSDVGKNGKR